MTEAVPEPQVRHYLLRCRHFSGDIQCAVPAVVQPAFSTDPHDPASLEHALLLYMPDMRRVDS